MRMMLRAKFLVPIILIVFVCISFLSYVSYKSSASILENKISEDQKLISNLLAEQIALWVSSVEATCQSQATRDKFRKLVSTAKPLPEEIKHNNESLKEVVASFSDYEGLNVCDRNGIIIASSNPSTIGFDLSKRKFVIDSKASGKTVVSDIIANKRDGNPIFVVITPVKIDEKISGFVTAVINCKLFSEKYVAPLKIGENGYTFVADSKGTILAHRDPEQIMKHNLNKSDWGKIILNKKNGLQNFFVNGSEIMSAFNTDEHTGWSISVCASIDDIDKNVAVIRNTVMIGGILTIVILSICIGYLLTKLVTGPITVIMDFLQRCSIGDTTSNKKYADLVLKMYKRKDEVGNMTVAAGGLRKYLDKKAKEAEQISNGDFTGNVNIASEDDKLGKSFTNMKERLNKTLTIMSSLIEQVTDGSKKFAAASQSLSSGATETAASLEEINSSVIEIGSQTKLNAENALDASSLANQSKQTAEKGNSDVEEMVVAMVDMQDSGQEIAKIVKMIDDIAFQTNLLSLNAAVEAARAGLHGKGFAVVAEEVRNLAGRSAKAAKETAELVDQTVTKLSNGAKIANNTQESLGSVAVDVVKVADILSKISIASNEQSEGINQISIGLQQIDQVTQNNTSNAEETSSAASSMSAQAEHLNKLMAQFKLEIGNNLKEVECENSSNTILIENKSASNFANNKMIDLNS